MDTDSRRIVVTFGTFDLFHIGHLKLLERAKKLGDYLIVGVSSDALNDKKKGRKPFFTENERMEIVKGVRYTDEVFLETSLELKAEYLKKFKASVLVMGDDWKGKFDWVKAIDGLQDLEVIYLPRTEGVSSTEIIENIKSV